MSATIEALHNAEATVIGAINADTAGLDGIATTDTTEALNRMAVSAVEAGKRIEAALGQLRGIHATIANLIDRTILETDRITGTLVEARERMPLLGVPAQNQDVDHDAPTVVMRAADRVETTEQPLIREDVGIVPGSDAPPCHLGSGSPPLPPPYSPADVVAAERAMVPATAADRLTEILRPLTSDDASKLATEIGDQIPTPEPVASAIRSLTIPPNEWLKCPSCGNVADIDHYEVGGCDEGMVWCQNCHQEVDAQPVETSGEPQQPHGRHAAQEVATAACSPVSRDTVGVVVPRMPQPADVPDIEASGTRRKPAKRKGGRS